MRTTTATPDRGGGLTPQERRIAELMAAGLSDIQIGTHLFLAERTVRTYVESVLSKTALTRDEFPERFGRGDLD